MANQFHALAEQLARIEHKLDLLLGKEALPFLHPMTSPNNCPACTQQVAYVVDPILKMLIRRCGCGTNLQAPVDLDAFAPPTKGKSHGRSGEDDGQDGDSEGPRRR